MAISRSNEVLICGMASGELVFRETHTLREVQVMGSVAEHGAILNLSFSQDKQYLFVGSADGHFSVLHDSEF